MVSLSVIIPIYKQAKITSKCVMSVLAATNEQNFRLLLIDDCSCDEDLSSFLSSLDDPRVELITNEQNLGFTKTVNKGMSLAGLDDVILLNSDTIVYRNWIDRLIRAAYSSERIASVNPLTNASHVSCYPYDVPVEFGSLEVSGEELDSLASKCNHELTALVHTTVGFCMYIKRDCLLDIGYFDALEFPVGYGEESDFCYRARRMGWQHVVAGDLFVAHLEGKSFGPRKQKLVAEMLFRFRALHPDFPEWDARFARERPLAGMKYNLDLARCGHAYPALKDMRVYRIHDLRDTSEPHVVADQDARTLEIRFPKLRDLPNLPKFTIAEDDHFFYSTLSWLGVRRILMPSCLAENLAPPGDQVAIEIAEL